MTQSLRMFDLGRSLLTFVGTVQAIVEPYRPRLVLAVEATRHLAEVVAPYAEALGQAALRAQPYLSTIADRFTTWEALAAPALLRVAPLLERAYAAARALKALNESPSHGPCFRAAEAVEGSDRAAIVRFTVEVLRLPGELWPDTAEVLAMTNDWWWEADPIEHLRRKTRAHAGRIERANWDGRRRTVRLDDISRLVHPDEADGAIEHRRGEIVHDVKAAFQRVGLEDEMGLALAAFEGHDRSSAALVLGLSDREAATQWKRIHRRRDDLARLLKK